MAKAEAGTQVPSLPLAEGVGFEPTDGVNRRWFSRPVLSTTQPPLRRMEAEGKLTHYSGKGKPRNFPRWFHGDLEGRGRSMSAREWPRHLNT